MPKQAININFQQGLDLKTDPFQVPVGKFLSLQNTIFDKGGLLQKRNGYGSLPSLPNDSCTYSTTLNDNLTCLGNSIQAYSEGSKSWVEKGVYQAMDLDVLTLIRSNTNQSQVDSQVSSNNIVCTVFTDNIPGNSGTITPVIKYVIADSITGQNIVEPTPIPVSSGVPTGSARVFILGNYFVIVFTNLISATSHLQYIAIAINNPTIIVVNTDIASAYTPSPVLSWDGYVAAGNLYIAYNTLAGGQAINVTYISQSFGPPVTPASFTGSKATILSVTADVSIPATPIIYLSWYDSSSTNGFVAAVDPQLNVLLAPTQDITSVTVLNLTSSAQGNATSSSSITTVYEVDESYIYDATIPTNYLNSVNVTLAGVVGSASPVLRSVGLASKSFILNGTQYFLCTYQSSYQPTYFLSDINGNIVAKVAYGNAGGPYPVHTAYLPLGLPSISIYGDLISVGYLYKDLIEAVNKNTNVTSGTQVDGIYSQTGINMVTFNFDAQINTIELGTNLNITGGFLWGYDGYSLTEQNFFLYPDYVETIPANSGGGMAYIHDSTPVTYYYQVTYEWTDNQGNAFRSAPSIPVKTTIPAGGTPITFTSVFLSGVSTITVSSVSGLFVGQYITDTTTSGNIQADTYITAISGSTITLSLPTAGASASSPGDTLSTSDTASVVINVPTLRLTYKINNPVKIVIYRWSTEQQIYYQVTSIEHPLLNITNVDEVAFTDRSSDAEILGNNIIYTNGGVVEDINSPATALMTIFDTRLWSVDSEDKNTVYYSKQVIENTPVEMSDLFTLYISPTIGAQGTPGPITAITNMDDKLLMSLGGQSWYYVNGTGPDNTGSSSQYSEPTFITSTVGCANERSIVFIPQGLMFQSNKGIWLLGRDLGTSYIGAPVENFNEFTVLSAVNVPGTNQVRFTLDNGVTLMYDYYYQQWGTFIDVPALSSTIYQGLHTYINQFGEVFQETVGSYLDGSSPVCISFTTGWFNLAALRGYERFHWFTFLGSYFSPHKLLTTIAYDYNSNPSQSDLITPTNIPNIYGSDNLYGGSSPYGGTPQLEQDRVFMERQLCKAFQISVNEIYDPGPGYPAGAGLTLSGISAIVTIKKGWAPTPASNSVG
jgi:hypothetical protein